MTDDPRPLEPDNPQLNDDLMAWDVLPSRPFLLGSFFDDAPILDEDASPNQVLSEHHAD